MPRLAILGATGKLGEKLVTRALEQGFSVNALARNPRAIRGQNDHLTWIHGDAETGAGLDALVEHCQYCVCAISSLKPVMERAMTNLLPLLEAHKRFGRFVLVSRLGTGESREQSMKVSGPIQQRLPVILAPLFRDQNLAEHRVRQSKVPWTIVRSTRLTDDPATGRVVTVGPTDLPPHRITRADLAEHLVSLLGSNVGLRAELTVGSD
jgi:uncharacterized protein YbjT (DUF2867 family)